MTVIAAYNTGEGVYIGCDGRATAGGQITRDNVNKIIHGVGRHGHISVAVCGSAGLLDLIRIHAADLIFSDEAIREFCDKMGVFLEAALWERSKSTEGGPSWWDLGLLLTNGADLYEIDGGLTFELLVAGRWSTKGTSAEADGAMWAMEKAERPPSECVWSALTAAARFRVNCGGRLRLYYVKPGGVVSDVGRLGLA